MIESATLYSSASLRIDASTGQIDFQDLVAHLGLVPMSVLVLLLQWAPEVVSRTQIFARIWPNQIVSDDALTRTISDLRAVLKTLTGRSDLIQTLPKRGYRWTASVQPIKRGATARPLAVKDHRPFLEKLAGLRARRWMGTIQLVAKSLLLALLFTTAMLWGLRSWQQSGTARVAVLPVVATNVKNQVLADRLNDQVRQQLLSIPGISILARSTSLRRKDNPLNYLARDFAARWIIEGHVEYRPQGAHVELNLIDAKTAIVVFSLSQDISSDAATDRMIADFIRSSGLLSATPTTSGYRAGQLVP